MNGGNTKVGERGDEGDRILPMSNWDMLVATWGARIRYRTVINLAVGTLPNYGQCRSYETTVSQRQLHVMSNGCQVAVNVTNSYTISPASVRA